MKCEVGAVKTAKVPGKNQANKATLELVTIETILLAIKMAHFKRSKNFVALRYIVRSLVCGF